MGGLLLQIEMRAEDGDKENFEGAETVPSQRVIYDVDDTEDEEADDDEVGARVLASRKSCRPRPYFVMEEFGVALSHLLSKNMLSAVQLMIAKELVLAAHLLLLLLLLLLLRRCRGRGGESQGIVLEERLAAGRSARCSFDEATSLQSSQSSWVLLPLTYPLFESKWRSSPNKPSGRLELSED
jgi:hypothetical protein